MLKMPHLGVIYHAYVSTLRGLPVQQILGV